MSLQISTILFMGHRRLFLYFHSQLQRYHTCVSLSKQKSLNEILGTMPKITTTRETLKHVKYRKKRERLGGKLPAPSTVDVQVIGSGARGAPKSIVISTDYSRYLFNCGEGTQRIANEQKMKLAKLENVFITNKSWSNMGGLLGMALTLESLNVPQITLHGPDGIEKVVRMAKAFNSHNSTIKIEKRGLSEGRYEDTAIVIDYVTLTKDDTVIEYSTSNETLPRRNTPVVPEGGPVKRARLDDDSPIRDCVVAYICTPQPPLRKLLLERCVDLGVPQGPLFGRLKEGEEITLDDGTVVTPEQVLSPQEATQPIIVMECPDLDYLPPLLSCEMFHRYQLTSDLAPDLIVHMSPGHVMDHPDYQTWMNKFGRQTQHIVLNERTSGIVFEGLYRIQTSLNMVDQQVFPLLPQQTQQEKLSIPQTGRVTLAETNLRYQYRPKKGITRDQCLTLDQESYVDSVNELTDVSEELEKLKQLKTKTKNPQNFEDSELPEVVFLGTGSAVPSKARNVSCILLQMEADHYMLLDCGEGSFGQMYRYYGDKVDDVLENLSAIFISHMHADHHLGMFGILEARRQVLESRNKPITPVLVLAPIQMMRWLTFYNQQNKGSAMLHRLVPLQDLLPHQLERMADTYTDVLGHLRLSEVRPVEVDHCKNAFGVCLGHGQGWTLVYSGDTMPCDRLVMAGEGCDLLIHEATMEDTLEEEAKVKTHSTTSQAIDVGTRMGAKFILLTHFSQRYSKIPVFNEKFSDNVGIAFDNMRVRMKDLSVLPLLKPCLRAIFAEDYAVMEEKTFKRTLNKIKENSKETKQTIQDFIAKHKMTTS